MSSATLMDKGSRQKIVEFIAKALADTYVLYLKTQNFHWNVEDERFYSLHKMFEKQYEELAEAVDDLAERIRALNAKSPATMKQFLELTSLEEGSKNLNGNAMLEQLAHDHTTIANTIRPWIPESQKHGDEGTADLFIERLRYHEKTAWMLRSHFE